MKAGTNETVLEEAKPILQMKRPLLPIDEYAAREGVTRSIVEKCGRLGIVQIRKYKGYKYVVDVPLSPYYHLSEETPILQESHKSQIPREMTTQATQKQTQPISKTTQGPKISELTRKVTADTHKIAGQPVKSKIGPSETKTMPELTKNMFDKASKFKKQLMGKIRYETNQSKAVSKPAPVVQNNRSEFDTLAEQARAKHTWQVVAVSLIVCLCAALLAGLWLYMNQRVHRNRLNQASASIQNVYDDSVRTGQQLATFQSKLIESTAELKWIKNELESTKAGTENIQEDIKSLRHEITKVREGLETLQQHNTASLEQLKEQFQQLTAQLSEFTQKR